MSYIVRLPFQFVLSLVEFQKQVSCNRAVWSSSQVVARLGSWRVFEFQGCIERQSAVRAVSVLMLACLLALDTVLGGRARFKLVLGLLAVEWVFRFVISLVRWGADTLFNF